jgi:hypothetical protein
MNADPTPSAPSIDELLLADDPAAWEALGFQVTGEHCQVGDVRLRLTGSAAGKGILEWSLRGIASTELDGLPTSRSDQPGQAERPATSSSTARATEAATTAPLAHPNGVSSIDHVVAISPALDRSVQALRAAGLDLRRIREQPTPAGAPRQAFFRLGAVLLEVVQEPVEVIERAGGADRPAHFWGLALRVEDLELTVARLGQQVSEIRAAVQPGRQIATLRRSAGLSLPVALISGV